MTLVPSSPLLNAIDSYLAKVTFAAGPQEEDDVDKTGPVGEEHVDSEDGGLIAGVASVPEERIDELVSTFENLGVGIGASSFSAPSALLT